MNSMRRDFRGTAQFVAQETLIKKKGVHYSRHCHIIKCSVWVLFGLVFFFRSYERTLPSKQYNTDWEINLLIGK